MRLHRRARAAASIASKPREQAPCARTGDVYYLADPRDWEEAFHLPISSAFLPKAFNTIVNDEGEVPKSAVRDLLILTDDAPMDDETLEGFMPLNSAAEGEFVGFFDFVRMSVGMSSTADSVSLTNRG